MNSLHITLIATLLTASSAYAGPALPWSHSQDLTISRGRPSAPHWSTYIGTGHASSAMRPDSEKTAPATAVSNEAHVHWTARIGTGHASPE